MAENTKITTIKLAKETKSRLDSLKEHKRESYEEVIEKILGILNICKVSPLRARARQRRTASQIDKRIERETGEKI